jgi:hypothetical protein
MRSTFWTLAAALSIWSIFFAPLAVGSFAHDARRATFPRQMNTTTSVDPPRQIDWDLSKIPVEPAKGTCHLSPNMTLLNPGNGVACKPYKIDTISVRSWDPMASTTCIRRSAAGDTTTSDQCFHPIGFGRAVSSNVSSPTLSYGSDRAFRVDGTLCNLTTMNFGFDGLEFTHVTTAASKVDFSSTYEAAFDYLQSGILGFGQYKSQWSEHRKDPDARNSYLIESLSYAGGPLPLWTLSVPRNDKERGVVVIGGFVNNSNTPSNKINILEVPTVPNAYATDEHGMAYSINVSGIVSGNQEPLNAPENSSNIYIIDTLSNVIRTDPKFAASIAGTFNPPATKGSANEPYYVDCSAKVTRNYGVQVWNGTKTASLLLDGSSMIVRLSENKCISAFQPPAADGVYRLGWPFLMNNIITFNVSTVPATLNITQKSPLA